MMLTFMDIEEMESDTEHFHKQSIFGRIQALYEECPEVKTMLNTHTPNIHYVDRTMTL